MGRLKGRVWVEMRVDNALYPPRKQTTKVIPAGGSEFVMFDWTPHTKNQQVEFKVDPQWFPICTDPNGCEIEYNENDNNTNRDFA